MKLKTGGALTSAADVRLESLVAKLSDATFPKTPLKNEPSENSKIIVEPIRSLPKTEPFVLLSMSILNPNASPALKLVNESISLSKNVGLAIELPNATENPVVNAPVSATKSAPPDGWQLADNVSKQIPLADKELKSQVILVIAAESEELLITNS
ncbi:hypothetical protein [Agaribacter flavus]|uniref:Uncharacterized protein n=1 Tax=Agaribacter flavus TaxID=1902781 RepID=A0ABV7FRT1_9ALTE